METPTRATTPTTELTPNVTHAGGDASRATVEDGLRRLSRLLPETAVQYSGEAIAALSADAQAIVARGHAISFDLLALVDRRFRDALRDDHRTQVEVSDVARVRGIVGVLRDRLETVFQALAAESSDLAVVARAILEEIRHTSGDVPDRAEIARRVGVAERDVGTVVAALLAPGGVLQHAGTASLVFSPPQLALVIEDDLAAEKPHIAQARRTVDEGVRSWSVLGSLLAAEGFGEVHRRRRHLVLHQQSCRFLLLSALCLPDDHESKVASTYWLGRLDDPEDVQDILLFATLSENATVRARGATLLARYPTMDAQERLELLALVDDDPAVRSRAVASLVSMQSETLRERLIIEATDPRGTNRLHAIQALAAFADPATVEMLQRIINDSSAKPYLREAAIQVLATFSTPESVNALIAAALMDSEDADVAAGGLATTQSEARNRQILDAVGLPQIGRLLGRQLAAVGLAMLAGAVGVAAWLFLLFVVPMTPVRPLPATVVGAGLLWVTSRRLHEVQRARLRHERPRLRPGTIALLVFVAAPLALIGHGLAHVFAGQWRRGLYVFVMQMLGVFLLMTASLFANVLFGSLNYFYIVVGVWLIAVSYWLDVLPVMGDVVLRGWVGGRERRRAAVYRKVFGNPEFVALVLHQVRSDEGHVRRPALKLLQRFASAVDPSQLLGLLDGENPIYRGVAQRGLAMSKDRITRQLEALWISSGPRRRLQIQQVLVTPPTAASLETLERLRPQLSYWGRVQHVFAKLAFRLRVWPAYVRALVVVSAPAVSLFVIFGYGALNNQAWSQIVVVDRYISGLTIPTAEADESERRMMATMAFLARNYPSQFAPQLLEYLNDSRLSTQPRIRASVARALIIVSGSAPELRGHIGGLENSIVEALLAGDSATFSRAVDDLAGLWRDPSDIGVRLLGRLILTRAPDAVEHWKPRAIRALANVHYSRAIPALDTLLKARSQGFLARTLRAEFNGAIDEAFDSVRVSRNAQRAASLLSVLAGLQPVPAQAETVRWFADSLAKAKNNPASDPLLAQIKADPEAEDGYWELLARFDENRRYKDALDTFALLKRQYRRVIWPPRIIARIQHERIADAAGFDAAYREMVELRALPAYHALATSDSEKHSEMEADFAEIAFAAKAYEDVERVGATLLADNRLPLDRRLNAALFIYFSRVMQRNVPRASEALARVESLINSAPSNFYNNWVYPGTRATLMRSGLPPTVRDPLIKLCREQFWYSGDESAAVFKQNRDALRLLGGK